MRHDDVQIVCGRNPVVELLVSKPQSVDKVFIQRGASGDAIDEVLRLAKDASVPVQRVPAARLASLAGKVRHQGVVALTAALSYWTLEDVLARAREAGSPGRVLFLDRVTDPRNFGAVLRSAAAFGVAGVLVPTQSAAPLNAAAVKASAGAALSVPVARVERPADTLDGLRELGYWIIGADGSAERSFAESDWTRPVVIALGSEGRGLARDVVNVCDELVAIPIVESVDSLNVSVAAAILMCAAFNGRAR